MSITAIKWKRDGLCGAACAQMVLHARGLVGTTEDEQEELWNSIKAHTTGASSAPAGSPCSGVISEPTFDGMIHDACGASVLCWYTYPTALKATLRARLGAGVPITLSKLVDEDRANSTIRKCLKRGALPIVLVKKAKHWVIVDDWDENDPQPVSVNDPANGAAHGYSLDDWSDSITAVQCAGCKFHHKYVIVQVGP